MAGRPATRARDARVTLEQVFDQIPDLDQKFKTLIEDAFQVERVREVSTAVTCKCCGEQRKYVIAVPLPDWSARVKAIDLLLTQAKGKPAETKIVDLNVTAVKTREELEAMSDEQLALVAALPQEQETDGNQGHAPHARRRRTSARRTAGEDGTDRA